MVDYTANERAKRDMAPTIAHVVCTRCDCETPAPQYCPGCNAALCEQCSMMNYGFCDNDCAATH